MNFSDKAYILAEVVLASLPERSVRQANSDYFLLTQEALQPMEYIVKHAKQKKYSG